MERERHIITAHEKKETWEWVEREIETLVVFVVVSPAETLLACFGWSAHAVGDCGGWVVVGASTPPSKILSSTVPMIPVRMDPDRRVLFDKHAPSVQ
jgi:hypothetical protein